VDPDSHAVRQQFQRLGDEGFYGLGQQQDGLVNVAGHNVELTTHNIEIAIPFLVSSRGWGLLWKNSSITRVGEPGPALPLADGFDLYDASGQPGGLTVRYFDGDSLLLEQVSADLNQQYLAQGNNREHPLPPEVAEVQGLRIEWVGEIAPRVSGPHELKMYSSGYAKLYLDNELLLDRWRMNWNPWPHNATVDLEAGHRYPLRLDWTTQGGYFRLLHYPPPGPELQQKLSIASETAKAVDYFFVASHTADDAVAGYRRLTGQATMLPKWAFGYWQSRERYKSQDELLGVLREYRQRQIPIDNIVLDWSYWPVDAWGSHDFDPEFFPDPRGMVQAVHDLDAQIMISVWPKFYPETDHYYELSSVGCMFNKNIEEENRDWIAPGYLNAFYDPFDRDCAALFWNQVQYSLNGLGFDAWWMDAVEPDMHSNLSVTHRKDLMTPNAAGVQRPRRSASAGGPDVPAAPHGEQRGRR
jgi:alpha-D-xyloside xylohydrolase